MKRRHVVLLTLTLGAACRDAGPVGPDASFSGRDDARGGGVTLLTRNVYLGADLDPLLRAPAEQVPQLAAATFALVRQTNFPERAQALAEEIARLRPHLVGLQEIELYRVQSPGDAVTGGTEPATTVAFDFLELLLEALERRRQHYVVAVVHENLDAEVPALAGVEGGVPRFDDIRLTDRDAILVRRDVAWSNPLGASFAAALPAAIGGVPFAITRGWTSVDATVAGLNFRFANTHLETQVAPPIQEAQARELLAIVASQPLPVILAGDFNSDAGGGQTPTYQVLRDAGYRDAWLESGARGPGLTCCHAADLRNPVPTLDQRIDLILLGAGLGAGHRGSLRVQQATVVGDERRDRTRSGLWPSDHAGVAVTLRVAGRGHDGDRDDDDDGDDDD